MHVRHFVMTAMAAGILSLASFAPAQAGGDAAKGKALFNRCAICHSNTKGAPNKMGPNLWGIVGSKAADVPKYNFSSAMKKSGIVWTDAKLDEYLTRPAVVVPGTKMAFAGISNAGQRADLIAYLNTLK
ncbi:MAG TPA: cytochrome c family protein [Rhizomicrobium sp.]|nr:cytochrome c family protein [Rhizomicrobium sp.]